jgi:hypothetical protein
MHQLKEVKEEWRPIQLYWWLYKDEPYFITCIAKSKTGSKEKIKSYN